MASVPIHLDTGLEHANRPKINAAPIKPACEEQQ